MATDTLQPESTPATPELRAVAAAWIDRFEALGGYFSRHYSPGMETIGAGMGFPMPFEWEPPARDNPTIPPCEQFLERSHHDGAIRALFGMLALAPALKTAVYGLADEYGAVLS